MDELDYKDHGRRGKWIIAVGLILALAAGGGGFFVLTQAQQQAATEGVPTASVVVAAREIAARKPIEAGDVALREVPQDVTNAAAFTSIDEVVGRISGSPSRPPARHEEPPRVGGRRRAVLDPGAGCIHRAGQPDLRAIRSACPTIAPSAGSSSPGRRVDVFVTATVNVPRRSPSREGSTQTSSTKLTYQDFPVLAKSGDPLHPAGPPRRWPRRSATTCRPARPPSLRPRPPEDTRTVDTAGLRETTNRIIEQYRPTDPGDDPNGGRNAGATAGSLGRRRSLGRDARSSRPHCAPLTGAPPVRPARRRGPGGRASGTVSAAGRRCSSRAAARAGGRPPLHPRGVPSVTRTRVARGRSRSARSPLERHPRSASWRARAAPGRRRRWVAGRQVTSQTSSQASARAALHELDGPTTTATAPAASRRRGRQDALADDRWTIASSRWPGPPDRRRRRPPGRPVERSGGQGPRRRSGP